MLCDFMDDLFPEQNSETAALLILVITAQIVANQSGILLRIHHVRS
jgi:hypothetical protein